MYEREKEVELELPDACCIRAMQRGTRQQGSHGTRRYREHRSCTNYARREQIQTPLPAASHPTAYEIEKSPSLAGIWI